MQQPLITIRTKFQLLTVSLAAVLITSIPLTLPHITERNGIHIGIHVAAISLASFLSIMGFLTFRQFRTGRLFLVMCGFITVSITEIIVLSTFVVDFVIPTTTIDSLITHGMILLMLIFFVIGIFRRD